MPNEGSAVGRLPGWIAIVAIIAAGCTSSSGGDSIDVEAIEPTTVVPSGTEAEDAPAPEPSSDSAGAPVPTELGQGVTGDTLKIGVSVLDLSSIGRDNGDVEAKWQLAIDQINEAGGVGGRQVELVTASYTPTVDTEAETACLTLTEDEQVFAVLGPQIFDQALCYTERHDTIVITPQPISREQLDRSTAPLLSIAPLPERTITDGIDAMAAEGTFDGQIVAIHASSEAAADVELARSALEAHGVDVAVDAVMASARDDPAAVEEELAVIAERWAAEEVDVVVTVGDGGHLTAAQGIGQNNADASLAMTEPDIDPALFTEFGAELSALEGAVGIAPPSNADLFDAGDAGVVECVERFEAASGETVNIRPEAGEVANLNTTVRSCQVTELFVLLAQEAGPALNNQSFLAATNALADFSLTGVSTASLAPDKPDASDVPPAVVVFDSATETFVPA